eukprot:Gb_28857 [translate_table: standard]
MDKNAFKSNIPVNEMVMAVFHVRHQNGNKHTDEGVIGYIEQNLGTNACIFPSLRRSIGVEAAAEHVWTYNMRVACLAHVTDEDTGSPIEDPTGLQETGQSQGNNRPKLIFNTVCTLTDMQYGVFHATIDSEDPEGYYIGHTDGCPVKSETESQWVIQCLKEAIERRVSKGLRLELCTSDQVVFCLMRLADSKGMEYQ